MKQQNSNPYLHPVGFPSAAPNPYQTQPPSFSPQAPPSASALFPAPQQGAALPSPSPSPVGAAPYRAHSFNYQQQQPQQQPAYQTQQQQQQQMYYQQQQQHAYQQAAAHGVPASYYQQSAQLAPAPAQGNAMRVSAGYIPTYQQPNPAAYQQPPQQPPQQQQQVFVQQGSQGNVYQPPPYQAVVQQQHQQNNHWDIQFSELQLGKELGRGAFGIVYKGRWRLTDVAVKINQGKLSPEDLRTFQAETQLMMNLRPHRNVVQLRGVCQNPLCVVIDFVDGGSLESRLHDMSKPMGWKKIFQLSQGICAGMLHIHLEGIVHRDLACRNVLLDATENALIADFGLSAQTFGVVKQEQGFFRGPYKWMAPESLAANQFSCASDVWSFGVTMWELLSRRLPFEDKTIYVVKDEVVTKKLRLPLPSKWPELWRNLLTACWRTDPAFRPDMATIGGWLHQMEIDYDKNPEADGYKVLPAVTAEELNIRAPDASSSHAASAPTEKLAGLSLSSNAAPSLHSSAEKAPSQAAVSSVAPTASVVSVPAPVSAPPVLVSTEAEAAPIKAEVAPSKLESTPSASKSASLPVIADAKQPSAPQSPTVRHRSAKGGIFDSVAKANSVDVADARPDAAHSPVPDRRV